MEWVHVHISGIDIGIFIGLIFIGLLADVVK